MVAMDSSAEKKSGIYGIVSKHKDRVIYVGSSKNMGQRKRQHRNMLKYSTHDSPALMKHCAEFGLDDMSFVVIEFFEGDRMRTVEGEYIASLRTLKEFGGCNTNPDPTRSTGATGHIPWNKGRPYTEEERKKISIATKKGMENPEIRARMSAAKKGIPPPRREFYKKGVSHNIRPVSAYDSEMNLIGNFPTAREAASVLGCCYKKISIVCQGKRPRHKGIIFKNGEREVPCLLSRG